MSISTRKAKWLFSDWHMETLEFVIYPDGRVKEVVTGIVGASCAEVTAAIEAQLGEVMAQEKSSEYYAQPVVVSSQASSFVPSQACVTKSRW